MDVETLLTLVDGCYANSNNQNNNFCAEIATNTLQAVGTDFKLKSFCDHQLGLIKPIKIILNNDNGKNNHSNMYQF